MYYIRNKRPKYIHTVHIFYDLVDILLEHLKKKDSPKRIIGILAPSKGGVLILYPLYLNKMGMNFRLYVLTL